MNELPKRTFDEELPRAFGEMPVFELDPFVLRRLIDTSRDFLRSRGYQTYEITQVVAQILAWVKLSLTDEVPAEWNILQHRDRWNDERLLAAEDYFGSSDNILLTVAFEDISRRLRTLGAYNLSELVNNIASVLGKGKIDWSVLAEALLAEESSVSNFSLLIPNEVAALGVELLGIEDTDVVYCPFQASIRFALQAAKTAKHSFFESNERSTLVASVLLLSDRNIGVTFSDPILNPTYVENGQLKRFDACLACGTFGAKRPLPSVDVFGRFSGKSFYSEITDARHVLAHTGRRALLVVPNGVLFRTAAGEREFKEEVVQRGWLKAVISLPDGLFSATNIGVSILVFDKEHISNDVLFIDATSGEFAESRRDRRGSKHRLINHGEIVRLFKSHSNSHRSRVVSRKDCEKQDYDLMVNRYVLSSEQEQIEQVLSKQETLPLSEVAKIVRGQAVKAGSDDVQLLFLEVGAVDIGPDGMVRTPEKEVFVDEKEVFSGSVSNLVLQPGDIVMAVKGSVGIIGLVPRNEDQPDGYFVPMIRMNGLEDVTLEKGRSGQFLMPSNLIVGQSYVIIRALPMIRAQGGKAMQEGIDPAALFMYLRSNLVQSWIKSKVSGSTVPLLQKQYIEKLPVIVPTIEQQRETVERHKEVVALQDEISLLQERVEQLLSQKVFLRGGV